MQYVTNKMSKKVKLSFQLDERTITVERVIDENANSEEVIKRLLLETDPIIKFSIEKELREIKAGIKRRVMERLVKEVASIEEAKEYTKIALGEAKGLDSEVRNLKRTNLSEEEIIDALSKKYTPFIKQGKPVYCEYCKLPIYKGNMAMFDCPEGEDFTTSLKCKWFHKEPQDCYKLWLKTVQIKHG